MSCRYFESEMKATILFLFLLSSLSGNKADVQQASSSYTHFQVDNENNAVRRGKERLQDYESRDSPCWKAAVIELKSKCSEMTDIEKSILAMKFANCHFKKSGLSTYDCTDKSNFQDCTSCMKAIDSSSFLVYTEFFTHVTDICFYLDSENSMLKTAETITLLSQAAGDTIKKLKRALKNKEGSFSMQNELFTTQEDIMEGLETLQSISHNATASVKDTLHNTKELITNLVPKIRRLSEIVEKGLSKARRLSRKFVMSIKIMKRMAIAPYFPLFILFYGLCTMLNRFKPRVWLFLLAVLFTCPEVLPILFANEECLLTIDDGRLDPITKWKTFGVCSLLVWIATDGLFQLIRKSLNNIPN